MKLICGINAKIPKRKIVKVNKLKTSTVKIWMQAIEKKKQDIENIKLSRFRFIALRKLKAIGVEIPHEPWTNPPINPTVGSNLRAKDDDKFFLALSNRKATYSIVNVPTRNSMILVSTETRAIVPPMQPMPPYSANLSEKPMSREDCLYWTIWALFENKFGMLINITASLASKKIASTGIVTRGLPAPVAPFKMPPSAKAPNNIK